MKPIVLHEIIDKMKRSSFAWVRDTPTSDEIEFLKTNALEDSKFDPLQLRKTTYNDLLENRAKLICRRGPFARVIAIVYPNTKLPWNLYSQIFSSFGAPPPSCVKEGSSHWTVYIYANPIKRIFPIEEEAYNKTIGPANINGGYAFPNDAKSIVIYREEESERVLIHELLHACGSDDMNHSVEIREAYTETWAELFLVALASNGSHKKGNRLWKIQSQWISDQNFLLYSRFNVKDKSDYPWRYTLARELVLKQFGIHLPSPTNQIVNNSGRFTSPLLLNL